MTLTELRYIITLADHLHFSKAAQACSVTQPTLSMGIKKLEERLGVAIFERNAGEVRVSRIGERIVAQARRVINEAKTITTIAHSAHGQLTMPLRIGAIYTIAPYLFPNLVHHLQEKAPNMPLIVTENFTRRLLQKLEQGDLDVIIIAESIKTPNLVCKKLFDEPFVVRMKQDHALAEKTEIEPADLTEENVLLPGEGHCLRHQVMRQCPSCYNPDTENAQTVAGTSLETLRHMVASGFGITILPVSATQVQHYNDILVTKPFAGEAPSRAITLVWRASYPRPKAIEALSQVLLSLEDHYRLPLSTS